MSTVSENKIVLTARDIEAIHRRLIAMIDPDAYEVTLQAHEKYDDTICVIFTLPMDDRVKIEQILWEGVLMGPEQYEEERVEKP